MKTASPINNEAVWAAFGSVAFALWFGFPLLGHIVTPGNLPQHPPSDFDLNLSTDWVALHILTRYHQIPLWNPYKCGGMPMLGNPNSAFLTPFVILRMLFGTVIGMRINFIAHIAVGFGGAYFLARVLRISRLGAIACAGCFAGSSWYYMHGEAGHAVFVAFAYLPWPIALLYLGVERRLLIPAALGGGVIALILGEGEVYALIMTVLVVIPLAVMLAIERSSFFPLLVLSIMGLFTIGFMAIKLLPELAFTGMYFRGSSPEESNHLWPFLLELFWRNQNPMQAGPPGTSWSFYEYGTYVGIFFGGLALLGSALRLHRAVPWLILTLMLLALSAGNFGAYSPWVLLHKAPFFYSMSGPERWLIPLTLVVGVLAGFGIDALSAVEYPWGIVAAALLVGVALVDDWLVSTPYQYHMLEVAEPQLPTFANFRQSSEPSYGAMMLAAAQANVGVLACYEFFGLAIPAYPTGYDQSGYRGEQYLLGPGTVTLDQWTPNALSFEVEATSPTVLVVNQNYDPSWRLAEGKGVVLSNDGLIAVLVPAGKQRLELTYRSRQFLVGLSITLATFAALLLLWGYEHRRAVVARPLSSIR